jgi:putative endonuclease
MPGSELQKIMFFYVYVLQSKHSGVLYIGYTRNLVQRVKEHNLGLTISTKPYIPWRLIYYEACLNQNDAKRREKYLKTSKGGRLLKRRLKEYLYQHLRFA